MRALWWIAGGLLAWFWADRLRDAITGMPTVTDISRPEWDRGIAHQFQNKNNAVGPGAPAGPELSLNPSLTAAGAPARRTAGTAAHDPTRVAHDEIAASGIAPQGRTLVAQDGSPGVQVSFTSRVPEGRHESVSVIVPACNEEANVEACLTSLLHLDYPDLQVIAINDRSTDHTGAVLDRLAAQHSGPPELKILHIADLPPGWLGKPHAMWTAAQQARGEWLLFTDADVRFRADSLRRAIAYAEQSSADHLVLFPTYILKSAGEKMMLGGFQLLFVLGHRPWKTADPKAEDFMGLGPFNLVRHRVYDVIGGFRALRMEVIEDMKLGKLVKRHGFAQRNVFGPGLLRWHWGHGAFGLVRNLTKNLFALMQFRWPKALGATCLLLVINLGPLLGLLYAPRWAKLPFATALAGIAGLYIGMARRSLIPARYFLLYPVSTVLLAYTMLRSVAHALRHNGIVWRGTRYKLEELRKGLV